MATRPKPPGPPGDARLPDPAGRRSRADFQRHAGPRVLRRHQLQLVEQQPVARPADRVVVERPLDLDPLDGVAGHAVLGRQRVDVLLVRAVDARAEQPRPVGADDLAGQQEHLDLADGRLRREIDRADRAGLAAARRVDADRLVPPAGVDLVQVRPVPEQRVVDRRLLGPLALVEPPGHAAAGDPDRVPGDPQLVAGRDRRPPAVPTVAARVAEDARHLADRLALAGRRAGRRGAAGADVRLGVRVEHRERQPVGQGAVLARPPVAQARLVAGVQLAGRLRRPLQARRRRQPQGVVGRVHEPLHRQVGHVERLAALVEAVGLAVLGQPVGDLRPRDAEQVAQGVLVLVPVEPPQRRPALAGQGRPLRGDDRLRAGPRRRPSDRPRRAGAGSWAASRRPPRGRGP